MKATPANEKFYWNSRAANYPQPFERETLLKTRRVVKIAESLGAEFAGRRVLDIGCGTGNYALPLAAKAKSVTGVDSSAAMLKVFKAEKRARSIKNARCVLSAWKALPAAQVAKRYDLALVSMSAAVRSIKDIIKMELAARERCVFIGWAGVRRNALLEKVYEHHGVPYQAPAGAEKVLPALKALGRKYKVRYIRDSWTKTLTPAETLRELEVNMRVNGARPDYNWLGPLLIKTARNGLIKQVTRARKAIITWRPG